jgi:DNA (cytosine-5)-methyltransferase 1
MPFLLIGSQNMLAERKVNGHSSVMRSLTAIDLFCGAGGLSTGFARAGFDILAGNDVDLVAGQTFQLNHPTSKFFAGPVQDVSAAFLLSATGLKVGELTCLIGGPPCQGFSVYNHQRGMHDARSHLFKDYLRMVKGLQPEWIVMENVTGLISIEGGKVIETIVRSLNELGYKVEWQVLKAELYGVPQERRRVVFIGTRTAREIRFPSPTHGPGLKSFFTVQQAIGDLPVLGNGGKADSATSGIQNHIAPKLSAINLARMKHIPEGGSWRDIPVHLLPEGMKRAKRSDHTKRYGRMRWDGLASTILTKCDIHWGAFIHPDQSRAISVREAARLQSFPDDFVFAGSMTDQFVQVGNSVPPLLAQQIAQAILHSAACDESRAIGMLESLVA